MHLARGAVLRHIPWPLYVGAQCRKLAERYFCRRLDEAKSGFLRSSARCDLHRAYYDDLLDRIERSSAGLQEGSSRRFLQSLLILLVFTVLLTLKLSGVKTVDALRLVDAIKSQQLESIASRMGGISLYRDPLIIASNAALLAAVLVSIFLIRRSVAWRNFRLVMNNYPALPCWGSSAVRVGHTTRRDGLFLLEDQVFRTLPSGRSRCVEWDLFPKIAFFGLLALSGLLSRLTNNVLPSLAIGALVSNVLLYSVIPAFYLYVVWARLRPRPGICWEVPKRYTFEALEQGTREPVSIVCHGGFLDVYSSGQHKRTIDASKARVSQLDLKIEGFAPVESKGSSYSLVPTLWRGRWRRGIIWLTIGVVMSPDPLGIAISVMAIIMCIRRWYTWKIVVQAKRNATNLISILNRRSGVEKT